jgi:hypothetical protein
LSEIIKNTPIGVVRTFLIWKTVQALADYVESDTILPYKKFRKELEGKVSLLNLFIFTLFL